MFKSSPVKIINQAFYFAIVAAILNLALPVSLWMVKIVSFLPKAVFIRELSFSLITLILAFLMKFKKHLLSAVFLFILACLRLGLITVSLFAFYQRILLSLNLLSSFYIGLEIIIVLLSLFFYYRAMKTLKYFHKQ